MEQPDFFEIIIGIAAAYFFSWLYGEMKSRYGGRLVNPIFVAALAASTLALCVWIFWR
jgi:uncharacterized membrane protein YeaQ/YmgE (transglycosylase-associated protein family)